MAIQQPYNFSLTGAYLMLPVCMDLATMYEQLRDWTLVKEKVVAEKVLSGTREATNKKRLHVLTGRLETLTPPEWEVYFDGTIEDQRQIILLATARYHRIVREFIVEVLREKYIVFNNRVLDADFEIFWRSKVAETPQLETIQEGTQRKIRNVIFSMLVEAGWLEGSVKQGFRLALPMPSERLIRTLAVNYPEGLLLFCLPDRDIKLYYQQYVGNQAT